MKTTEVLLTQIKDHLGEGCYLACKERLRQIEEEGWSAEHDDQYTEGQLADAGATYALTEDMLDFIDHDWGNDKWLHLWPFHVRWYKNNGNRLRNLEKAAALIIAEIDRIKRLEQTISKAKP